MKIFTFGSRIDSSYWNEAPNYYRGCYKYLAPRGRRIAFAEPDAYGRQQHRDQGDFSRVESIVYKPGRDLDATLALAASADVVTKHSGLGCDDGALERRVLECQPGSVVFFEDVDAPATMERMQADPPDAFHTVLPKYDATLTYGAGPVVCEQCLRLGARAYYSIYNGLDPETHFPVRPDPEFHCDVVSPGNRLPDREVRVEELFFYAAELAPDKRFLLGGEGWGDKPLPANHALGGPCAHCPTQPYQLLRRYGDEYQSLFHGEHGIFFTYACL